MELDMTRIIVLWGGAALALLLSYFLLRKSKSGKWVFILLALCYVLLNIFHWKNRVEYYKTASRFDVSKNVEYFILANGEALVLLILAFLAARYLKRYGR